MSWLAGSVLDEATKFGFLAKPLGQILKIANWIVALYGKVEHPQVLPQQYVCVLLCSNIHTKHCPY